MSATEYGSPWTGRIIAAIVCLGLVIAGVYGYTRILQPSRQLERLEAKLKSAEDPMVRAEAVREIALMNSEEAVPLLKGALEDEDDHVKRAAAGALGQMRAQSAADALIDLLQDKSPDVRRSAVTALGLLKCDAAVDPLLKLLKDKSALVRAEACYALAEIGNKAALAPIEKMGKSDRDPDARFAAQQAAHFLKTGSWEKKEG